MFDVARDPRWGWVEETYSEDPVLTGTIGTAYVQGLKGDDLRHGVAAQRYARSRKRKRGHRETE